MDLEEISVQTRSKNPDIDLKKIYENDLFDTYKPEVAPPKKPDYAKPIPTPPEPVSIPAPKVEEPKFLDPLPITLTGIFMLNDETLNRAIIIDNKSKEEITYKNGDEIEDAQLVKIFSNKVLLIRSNGQQEILYLNQEDAKFDELAFSKKDWSHVVKKTDQFEYRIDKEEFAYEVKSLSNIIDLFNLTTAYKQGKSIGAKIGQIDEASIAYEMGFKSGDIITKINKLPATTTTERLAIYKEISKLPDNSSLDIEILRNNSPEKITLTFGTIKPRIEVPSILPKKEPGTQTSVTERYIDDKVEEEKRKILRTKEKFAPTLQEIQLKEKANLKKLQQNKKAINKDTQ